MLQQQKYESKQKYGWVNKWVKMTDERARTDAKVNKTYITYEKMGIL